MKELAKETAKATEDISWKIESIQMDTKDTVQAIGTISGIINDISATIASAVEEQNATSSEMSRNVTEAAQGSEGISKNIAGVAEAALSTSHRASDSQKAAHQLGEDLRRTEGVDGQIQVLTRTSTHRLARRYRCVLCRATVLRATGLIQFFAGEVEERAGQKQEHDQAEEIVGGERAKQFRTKREKIRPPG